MKNRMLLLFKYTLYILYLFNPTVSKRLAPVWHLTLILIFISTQLINAVVLLILLSALNDPVQYRYHLTSSELGTDIDVMDDASELG